VGARKECTGARGSVGESKGSTAAPPQGSGVLEERVEQGPKGSRQGVGVIRGVGW
jgi:hypothetical protein